MTFEVSQQELNAYLDRYQCISRIFGKICQKSFFSYESQCIGELLFEPFKKDVWRAEPLEFCRGCEEGTSEGLILERKAEHLACVQGPRCY